MDNVYRLGDLVQFKQRATYPLYYKLLHDKIGVVADIRINTKVAYIKWADTDANDTWVSYDDLVLLNRE